MSSSGDEDPEYVNGYVAQGGMGEKTKELKKVASKGGMHFNGSATALPESVWHGSGDFANQMFYIVVWLRVERGVGDCAGVAGGSTAT